MTGFDRLVWALVTREAQYRSTDYGRLVTTSLIRQSARRWLVRANMAVMRNAWQRAMPCYLKSLHADPDDITCIISFGTALAAYATPEDYDRAWRDLGGASALSQAASLPVNRLLLLLEIGLCVGDAVAVAAFKTVYLRDHLLADRVLDARRTGRDALLFWHIPKCGGTSFNAALSHLFYRSGTALLPSYHTPNLLRCLVEQHMDEVPFLSSAHLETRDLPDIPASVTQIAIMRDPVRRALSAWRQYRDAPEARLLVLPQHGRIWDALPAADLDAWARRCPSGQINKMTHTFDAGGDPQRAAERAGLCAHLIDLAEMNDRLPELCETLGLDLPVLPRDLNVSRKDIGYDLVQMAALEEALSPDCMMYDVVSGF